MSRILSALSALTRRMFSPAGPSARTSDMHRAWMSEQMREYSVQKIYAGPLDADLNPTGETWEMRLAYRKALKEPAIKGPLLKKVYAVASLPTQVLPEDEDNPASKESAAWVDYAITNARGGWPRLIHDCCIHPLIEGFGVGEKVPERVERGKWKDRWGLHAVKFKETKDLRFKLDRYRNVESIRSFAGGQGGSEFDTRDFVLLTHMPLWENPFGQSDLRAAYRAINLIEASIKLRGDPVGELLRPVPRLQELAAGERRAGPHRTGERPEPWLHRHRAAGRVAGDEPGDERAGSVPDDHRGSSQRSGHGDCRGVLANAGIEQSAGQFGHAQGRF